MQRLDPEYRLVIICEIRVKKFINEFAAQPFPKRHWKLT